MSRTLARLMAGDLTYAWIGDESVFELSLPVMEDEAMAEGPSSQTARNPELGVATAP